MLARPGQGAFHQERRQHHAAGNAVGPRPDRVDGRRIARIIIARSDLVEEGARLRMAGQDLVGRVEMVRIARVPSSERSPACRAGRRACGKCSQIGMPGTLVAIGRNSPRIPSGASGFMSNESMWLSPPVKNTRITDLARGGDALVRLAALRTRSQEVGQAEAQQPRESHLNELTPNNADGMAVARFHDRFLRSLDRSRPWPLA